MDNQSVSLVLYLFIASLCSCSTLVTGTVNEDINRLLQSCGFQSAVLVTDDNKLTFPLLQWMRRHGGRMSHLDMRTGSPHLETWIKDSYVRDQLRDFIVVTENPQKILDSADGVFRNKSHTSVEALPHLSRWLVFVWTQLQVEKLKGQQERSLLDNVAVIQLTSDHPSLLEIDAVWTFMWRERRRKESSTVRWGKDHERNGALFPNTKYGLNGRELKVLAKSALEIYLSYRTNPKNGEDEYTGILIYLIGTLSMSLNFTYQIFPSPSRMKDLSWNVYVDYISNKSADIYLPEYPISSSLFTNVSVSQSINYDRVTGIYRKPKVSHSLYGTFSFIFPFSVQTYIEFVASLLSVTALYTVIVQFFYGDTTLVMGEDDVISDAIQSDPRPSKSHSACKTFVEEFVRWLYHFSASALNQDTLPRPRLASARFLVTCLALLNVCLYSLYTSNYTASTIINKNKLPFNTFDEMVAHGEYRWGFLRNNSIVGVTINDSKSKTMMKLNKDANITFISQYQSIEEVANDVLDSLPDKFVFIYYESVLKRWAGKQEHPSEYIIMKDTLFQYGFGLAFVNGSELNHLFSSKILHLYDLGYLDKIIQDYNNNTTADHSQVETVDSDIGKKHVFIAVLSLIIALVLVAFAFLILIYEIVKYKFRRMRSYSMSRSQ